MFRNRLIALPLVLAAPFAVSACGGDDNESTAQNEAATAASTAQQPATTAPEKPSAEASDAAPKDDGKAKKADGDAAPDPQNANAAMVAMQKQIQESTAGLQKQIQDIQKQMTDGKISAEAGQKKLAALTLEMQEAIIDAAEEVDRAGDLPADSKKQLEAMKQQIKIQKQKQ